jgi:hypothetical protein
MLLPAPYSYKRIWTDQAGNSSEFRTEPTTTGGRELRATRPNTSVTYKSQLSARQAACAERRGARTAITQRTPAEIPMKLRTIAFALTLAPLCPNFAQAESVERNATQQEIVGNWQLLPIPDSAQPTAVFNRNPWPAACQWFSYSASGGLQSIDATSQPCEQLTSAGLDAVIASMPAVVSWKYDLSPVYNKALVIVSRTDVKHYAEYWAPLYVTRTVWKNGQEFREGDLVLYLIDMPRQQGGIARIAWIRHLRRLQ